MAVADLIGKETITHGLIAHATSNEYRLSAGGEIGDQCGHELCACTWFDAGWTAVYVGTTATALERMARFVEDAVTNGFFGYSQEKDFRRNFIDKVKETNFQPDLININRVCDCSSLIYGAVLAAGYAEYPGTETDDNGVAVPVIPNTAMFEGYLESLGFQRRDDPATYLRTYKNLKRGYILFMPGHIAIWI